ncbi:MAG TPA: TetR family transcriptional regulator [Candidatus Baltobacteraceae bacterium]|jgi:TetR/AcrR family transcriptional repressor of nem operon|nr:TetR family transcriptional regulator [Candidatus Baltobacteraceae bacterium]
MARPREFEAAAVLDAAMDCFWDRGYSATSVRDLSDATRLALPSLYNAFGGKSELFRTALDRYFDRNTRPRLEKLAMAESPLRAIRAFLTDLVNRAISDRRRRGCLLINSAVELASCDKEVVPTIRDYLSRMEAFLCAALHAAKTKGELSRSANPRDLARLLLSVIVGIRVLARTRPERGLLEGIVSSAMASLQR